MPTQLSATLALRLSKNNRKGNPEEETWPVAVALDLKEVAEKYEAQAPIKGNNKRNINTAGPFLGFSTHRRSEFFGFRTGSMLKSRPKSPLNTSSNDVTERGTTREFCMLILAFVFCCLEPAER